VDNGIGPYEFWGSKGVHHDYCMESDCCEAAVLDGNGRELDADIYLEDLKAERQIEDYEWRMERGW
jgi:hypothetical protein